MSITAFLRPNPLLAVMAFKWLFTTFEEAVVTFGVVLLGTWSSIACEHGQSKLIKTFMFALFNNYFNNY